ncbi:MAG: hypothetical protein ACREQ9_25305, partial [Candidatus Binatia bacterium]
MVQTTARVPRINKAAEKRDLDSTEVFLLPEAWLEPEAKFVEPPHSKRGPLFLSALCSIFFHVALFVLLAGPWLAAPPERGHGGSGSALFSVVFVEQSGTPGSPDAAATVAEPVPPAPAVLPVTPPAPIKPPPVRRVKPLVRAPKVVAERARTIDGVR